MNFMFYILLFIYSTTHTSRASSPKKHVYFQIDEFIKQLMTSEKFDELADVIADKAAQKIRHMENPNTTNYDKESLRVGDNNKNKDTNPEEKTNHEDKKSKENESKSKEVQEDNKPKKGNESKSDPKSNYNQKKDIEKDTRSKEMPSNDHDSNKKKDARSDEKSNSKSDKTESHKDLSKDKNLKPVKFGNIDTQAFLNNHRTSKELELNYKHLTGELGKHRYNVKDNNPKTQKEYERQKHSKYNEHNRAVDKHEKESDKSDDSRAKNAKSQETKTDSKEFKLSDHSSNENAAHEQATFHDVDENINSKENRSTNDSDSAKLDTKHNKFQYAAKHSDEKPIPRVEGLGSENYDEAKTLEEELKTLSQELNIALSSSKEIVEVRINRAKSEEILPSHDTLSVPILASNTSQRKQGKHVREENGKYFTLETSLEYAEYHENVRKKTPPQLINL